MALVADIPAPVIDRARPGPLARFARTIPLPRGPQWYLVVYRWMLVAASLYTISVTWNVWQNRSNPNFHKLEWGTPANFIVWEDRPSDAELAPMLPVWEGLPQFDFGWLIVGSLVLILVRPRAGLTALAVTLVLSVLWDRTRIQPHYVLVFMMLATLPNINAQLVGRANLIALWFWAGFHKLIIDFIKPDGMSGFRSEAIPYDLGRFFPVEHYSWNTHNFGVAIGWVIAISELSLALMCFVPRARWFVAFFALAMHAGIVWWNCLGPHCNLLGWNIVLALAGFALILPWREWPWVTWLKCNWVARVASIFLLVSPAAFYVNWFPAYLSHCVYVPNNPFAKLYRPGEEPKNFGFIGYEVINFPLTPSISIYEAYFDKIRRPGDVMVIHDPRPWAESHGYNGRQYTDFGEFPRGKHKRYWYEDGKIASEGSMVDDMQQGLWISYHPNEKIAAQGVMIDDDKQGLWVQYHSNGNKESLGNYKNGREDGLWTFWYSDGQKDMEGHYVDGKMDGRWTSWTPSGERSESEFHENVPVAPH